MKSNPLMADLKKNPNKDMAKKNPKQKTPPEITKPGRSP